VDIQWPAFQQPVEIKIEAITFSKEVADQLHMGISRLIQGGAKQYCWEWSASGGGQAGKDTCLEEKLKVQTGPSEGKFAKIWIMDSEMFKKAGFARLIISNVAPPPTSKFPDAPGPQATTAAENVVLRYGFARVEAADEYPPPTQISPMGPATLMGELKPYKIDLAGPVLLASTSPMSYMMQSSQQGQVDTRELLYGIKPGAPLDIDELPDLSSFQIGEAGEKHYTITPVKDLGLGYTGPLKASVDLGGRRIIKKVSSDICLAGTLDSVEDMPPVGSIEKSSELQLEIRISTDLCELDPMRRQEPPMPVVDHFEATLILPLGWRYYSSTAPADVMTPGTQVYMDRYHQQMMSVPGIENIMNSYLGGSDGTSGGSGGRAVSQAGCDCSCEGLKTVRAQNRNKAGMTTEQKMTQATCAMQCVQQWKACPTQASVSSQGPVDQNQAGVVTDDGTPQYPATAEGEIEAILDTMVGKSAPDSVRNSIRSTVEEMSPDERAQILHAQNQPGSEVQHASGPYSQTGAVSIPVNPDWDAETLRYKAAVEQLGLLPDITEDAVEMFFSNEQPMRERLWQNIREQLARKQQ
jgi:hypothetical protein